MKQDSENKNYWRKWYIAVFLWLVLLLILFKWFTNSWR